MTRTLVTSRSNDDKDPSFEAGVTMTRTLVTSGCNDNKNLSFGAGVTDDKDPSYKRGPNDNS